MAHAHSQTRRSGPPVHWADQYADRIIAEKGPLGEQKKHFTCASGITPSGTIHIGNFREIISVDLVVRALRDAGQEVRFIYSWDDYDRFRKVPANMPNKEMLGEYMGWPITNVPDPFGELESYAARNEHDVETMLPLVGVEPEYLYQSAKYRASEYAEGIRRALESREEIRAILNEHRTEPLPADWYPVSVFSSFTKKDEITVLGWDGEWGVTYRDDQTGEEETIDLRETGLTKLPWRIDWPMRWKVEGVDFEPAGKEHHSAGGSFDTAKEISSRVYEFRAPVTFKYDFISIKGRGGKISSSTGEVIGLPEVLEVYEPEIVRYLFAGTRPNAEFAISFDLDVIKIYEDYDRTERIYLGRETVNEKRAAKERRVYELSQLPRTLEDGMPPAEDFIQIPFRTLCNYLMISAGNVDAALDRCAELDRSRHASQLPRIERRARCAWNWITGFAPEEFRFALREGGEDRVELLESERVAVSAIYAEIRDRLGEHDEKSLQERIYRIAEEAEVDKKQLFVTMYRILIGKERGPRLGGFLLTIGAERVLSILEPYCG